MEKKGKMRAGKASDHPQGSISKRKPANGLSSASLLTRKSKCQRHSIVVVDDHPLFAMDWDSCSTPMMVSRVRKASSAPEAMTLIRKLKPDMVIVDLGLKGPGGLELTNPSDSSSRNCCAHPLDAR